MSEPNPKTIESIIQNFFYDFNKRSQSQHSNLVKHLESFLIAYSDLNNPDYAVKLDKIKYSPIEYFIENNPLVWKEQETKRVDRAFLLSDLDFIYFRDSSFLNNLKRSYKAQYSKTRHYNKKITLSQITAVLNYVRGELYKDLVRFSTEKHFSINVYLPEATQTVQVQQVGY
jgi:hypothetical protein